ncbi:bcl-2-binding component 3, isoforms 3/4-like [Equus przewalskii]|uniref:Bcl-2-binding component 3, isoforms 3/4-like n=1 Tax=Equus przewalskii TaxID=9798 RepID=A0ABM4QAF0_EQUPR
MMHPCPGGARAPGSAGPRTGTPGSQREQRRPRPPLAGSRARRLRRARLQPGLRPRGAGRGRGRRATSFPSVSGSSLLRPPCAWRGCRDRRDSPPGTGKGDRLTRHPQPCAKPAGGGSRAGTPGRQTWAAAWAAGCTCAPRPGETWPSFTPRSSGNPEGGGREGAMTEGGHGRSLASLPSGRGLNYFQMKTAAPGLLPPGFGKPQLGTRRRGSQPLAASGAVATTWSPGEGDGGGLP